MASNITEFVGEVTRERWRSREEDSDFVIAECVPAMSPEPFIKAPATTEAIEDDPFGDASLLPQPEPQQADVVVLGNAPRGEFIPGLTYRFGGRWEPDRKDRSGKVERQFKFTHYTKAEPHSRYGLVNYLAKFAPGIGPVIANRLFDSFGPEAVKVLREFPAKAVTAVNESGRLNSRMLLTLEKAETAAVTLKKMGVMEDTKIELVGIFSGRGFPHSLVDQCLKIWGVLAPTRVARDPFSMLIRRLAGCGFARCKRLYDDLGLPPGRLKVQMLCLWHSLRTDNAGHTWFPAEQCKRTLEQSISGVKVGLRSRWLAKRLDADGKLWLAEFTKSENEQIVAERLAELLNDPPTLPAFKSEIEEATLKLLSEIEEASPVDGLRFPQRTIWTPPRIEDAVAETESDRIARFVRVGKLTGVCQFCSLQLTDPISLKLGYGPTCGPKNNLPWGEDVIEREAVNV